MDAPEPPPLERAKRSRKKPDLSGVEPQAITIKTKAGENFFGPQQAEENIEIEETPEVKEYENKHHPSPGGTFHKNPPTLGKPF